MIDPLKYLKFLLTATNQHGVHSPFIYSYVTKCLYSKPKYPYSKSVNVLLKSMGYFGAEQVWLPTEQENVKKPVLEEFPRIRFGGSPTDVLFLSASKTEKLVTILSEDDRIHNDSIMLVDAIHRNKINRSAWEKLKNHEKVTVTVDMFHCGAVFFRKEQANEHFKIRI